MSCIGIDLGTTYSAVGIWINDHVEIIPNTEGRRITPSYVSFTQNEIIVGDAAKNKSNTNVKNTIYDAKRILGKRFDDEQLQSDILNYPYEITRDVNNMPQINVTYKNELLKLKPEQISAYVLSYLKTTAETYLKTKVTNAVITVPAYFNDSQRQATKQAAQIAGLNCLRIINEPTAACLCYGLDKKSEGSRVLIFDLGGGTFDVSMLKLTGGIFEVIATCGDAHLGGEDFDNAVTQHILEHFKFTKENCNYNKLYNKIKTLAENAKRSLSSLTEVTIVFEVIDTEYEFILTRNKFNKINESYFNRTLEPVIQLLKDSHMKKEDVDEIILVGGSTRIPRIREIISDFFGGKELNMSVHPDEAVAYGAAIQAAILTEKDCVKTKDLLLLDVTPLSLGVESKNGVFSCIIPRNTTIPVKMKKMYSTSEDKQTEVEIIIFEGERAFTKENHKIGNFTLSDIPKQPRGCPKIEVTFDIDRNGILSVHAYEKDSGVHNTIEVTNGTQLSQEDINKMIEDAEKHRMDDELRKAALESKHRFEKYLFDIQKTLSQSELTVDNDGQPILQVEEIITLNKTILGYLDWLENDDITKVEIENVQSEFEFEIRPYLNKLYTRKKQLDLQSEFIKQEETITQDQIEKYTNDFDS